MFTLPQTLLACVKLTKNYSAHDAACATMQGKGTCEKEDRGNARHSASLLVLSAVISKGSCGLQGSEMLREDGVLGTVDLSPPLCFFLSFLPPSLIPEEVCSCARVIAVRLFKIIVKSVFLGKQPRQVLTSSLSC
jgi:hypothetical protein